MVVANVFEQRWQIRPFYELAEKLGVQVATLKADWSDQKNHSVPLWVIDGMSRRWQTGYGESVTLDGVVLSVPRSTAEEVVFRLETYSAQSLSDPSNAYVRVPRRKLIAEPFKGEVWRVTGVLEPDHFFTESIRPKLCERIKPTGLELLHFMINHNSFYRIGSKTANRLYDKIPHLEEVLDSGEVEQLIAKDKGKLSQHQAEQLLVVWKEYMTELQVSQWLGQYNLPVSVTAHALTMWGHETCEKISEDPYRLLAFHPWAKVDELARVKFDISAFDPRRLSAAAEQVCYLYYDKGNTAVANEVMQRQLSELLGNEVNQLDAAYDVWKDRLCYFTENRIFQLAGAYALEHFIEEQVSRRLCCDQAQGSLNAPHYDLCRIVEFENHKTIELRSKGVLSETEIFRLNNEQQIAVKTALYNPVCAIFGGAGVGKTTILEAIYDQIDNQYVIFPIALTGRAVKVMKDKTGYNAQTIAKFVHNAKIKAIPQNAWIFVDESSMLDLPTTYSIFRVLPDSARICFIGDHCQLPPIGPGLIFHRMYQAKSIPQVELFEVHRQSAVTGIPQFANELRTYIHQESTDRILQFDMFHGIKQQDAGVSFIEVTDSNKESVVLRTYNELASFGEVKVIAAVNKTCRHLNEHLANDHRMTREYNKESSPVLGLPVVGNVQQIQLATIGDPILWHSINDYQRSLYNGMLGTLTHIYVESCWGLDSNGRAVRFVAEADFDGNIIKLTDTDVDSVALGYAITCHKAQGSQFERVIVIVESTGTADLIDNTWLYTAITRAERQVVVIGDKALFDAKVVQKSKASKRLVGLHF